MFSNISKEQYNITSDVDSSTYFRRAIDFFKISDYTSTISFINLAISVASKKEFYMFQKIKTLFVLGLYSECSNYIEEHILFFYKNCSLYIFSHILHYYHHSTDCSTYSLRKMLSQQNIPTIIASEYTSIMNKDTSNLFKKATIAKSNSDFITCINYCNLILQQTKNLAPIYCMKAECHHLLSQLDLAISMYKKAITLTPDDDLIHHTLGVIMMELGRYAEAISSFEKAIKIFPSSIEYKINLGEAYYQWRKYDSALKCFKKVIAKNPMHIESYLRIAEIYIQINQNSKGKKYYKKANKIQKKAPTI